MCGSDLNRKFPSVCVLGTGDFLSDLLKIPVAIRIALCLRTRRVVVDVDVAPKLGFGISKGFTAVLQVNI